jgi:hypothetical protein
MKKQEKTPKTRFERFAIVMALLQEVFCPGKPVSEKKVEIYFRLLEPFSIDAIEKVAEQIIRTKKIHAFPLPTDFFEYLEASDDNLELEALEMWNNACQLALMSEYPSKNEKLNLAIRISFGSWKNFGETDPQNSFDRRHFVETYKRMRKKEIRSLVGGKEIKKLKE